MHTVTIHEAKTHLSRLIQETLEGEEVIIAKGKTPLVKIEPIVRTEKKRRFGGAKKTVLSMSDDFNEPLDDFSDYM